MAIRAALLEMRCIAAERAWAADFRGASCDRAIATISSLGAEATAFPSGSSDSISVPNSLFRASAENTTFRRSEPAKRTTRNHTSLRHPCILQAARPHGMAALDANVSTARSHAVESQIPPGADFGKTACATSCTTGSGASRRPAKSSHRSSNGQYSEPSGAGIRDWSSTTCPISCAIHQRSRDSVSEEKRGKRSRYGVSWRRTGRTISNSSEAVRASVVFA